MKWKVPASKSEEFKFPVDTNQSKPPWGIQTGSFVFKFGNSKTKKTPEEPKYIPRVAILFLGKVQVESKKLQGPGRMGHTTRKHRKPFSKPRKDKYIHKSICICCATKNWREKRVNELREHLQPLLTCRGGETSVPLANASTQFFLASAVFSNHAFSKDHI